jgi:alpha-mannosidase
MKNTAYLILASALLLSSSFLGSMKASEVLWSIGTTDQSSADLALGADHPEKAFPQKFPKDPLFIIGKSDPLQDWPAIQSADRSDLGDHRNHAYQIAFGLKAPVTGPCRLIIDLVDVDKNRWPSAQMVVTVNNHPLPVQAAKPGNTNDTLDNHPEKGEHQSLTFDFPGEDLRTDCNVISIMVSGRWILYDALHLETPDRAVLTPPTGVMLGEVTTDNSLSGTKDAPTQALRVPIYWFPPAASASVQNGSLSNGTGATHSVDLNPGYQVVEFVMPAVHNETPVTVSLASGGQTCTADPVVVKPMRMWTIYILPHSHHDLGYTDIQPHIIDQQMHNFDVALDQINKTKDYPKDARFIWNAEVLWSLDDYLNHYPEKTPDIVAAIKDGSIYPNGWYADELTGLCRPEELLRLSTFGMKLQEKTNIPIDSAMLSDVALLSWGSIQALNEAGIRYLSYGFNGGDRDGYTRATTEDKPFYWVSPSGTNKLLFWAPWQGYHLASGSGHLQTLETQQALLSHLEKLEADHYPYDMIYVRWAGFGDNAAPDEGLAPFVKSWNETHLSPHFIITDTSTAFHALEDKYGKQLPVLKGELTPYWEDGAGSSAHETALNRQAAEQLVQAETLFALLKPQQTPVDSFYQAWRKVLLYDEHTWGAWDSIRQPTRPGVLEQWKYKQAFAVEADKESQDLLTKSGADRGPALTGQFDVFNTCNWTRSDVVTLSKEASAIGDVVKDTDGKPVLSQRLSTGELAFWAKDVPPLASKRFTVVAGKNPAGLGSLKVGDLELSNSFLTLKLDPKSGGITEWTYTDHPDNLIDTTKAKLNDFAYVLGAGLDKVQYPGTPTITVKESGPLVASLLVQSSAPGAKSLSREIKIYNGSPRVDLIDHLDKTDVLDVEAGHVAFPFNLPDGQVRLDSQFAVVRPEIDQIPGANKNWFTVSRWADVSNAGYGVTLATQDAPLVEVGGITATIPRQQSNPNVFLKKLDPTQTLYSYIFNNHWETNYKASQSGMLTYRYSLQSHHEYNALAASRFGIELSQPLLAFPASGPGTSVPRMTIDPDNLLVTAFKNSDDGKAWIVRFFNPSDVAVSAEMKWSQPQPTKFWQSDMSEKPLKKIDGKVTVPAWSLLTVRAEPR